MLHPVGPKAQSVYWRRRLTVLASVITLIVLLVVTVRVLFSDAGSAGAVAAGHTSPVADPATPAPTPAPSTPSAAASSSAPAASSSAPAASGSDAGSGSASGSGSSSSATSSPPPVPCTPPALALAAATDAEQYRIGSQPQLSILVTNKTKAPCVQDLADPQIVLRVYNGESRVWGSHDCKIEPGTDQRTLMPGATVRVTIVWSGLTSQPNCAGTRQPVGAGTYTLFASLSGHEAKAAQFTIS